MLTLSHCEYQCFDSVGMLKSCVSSLASLPVSPLQLLPPVEISSLSGTMESTALSPGKPPSTVSSTDGSHKNDFQQVLDICGSHSTANNVWTPSRIWKHLTFVICSTEWCWQKKRYCYHRWWWTGTECSCWLSGTKLSTKTSWETVCLQCRTCNHVLQWSGQEAKGEPRAKGYGMVLSCVLSVSVDL